MQKKVIHSSGKKRRGARSDVAASHVAASHVAASHVAPGARRLNNKAIVHFAPNFTVYALPSNSVCLYSEGRKFFLHVEQRGEDGQCPERMTGGRGTHLARETTRTRSSSCQRRGSGDGPNFPTF